MKTIKTLNIMPQSLEVTANGNTHYKRNEQRIYDTPTYEKVLSFKRPETCPVYTTSCILWF